MPRDATEIWLEHLAKKLAPALAAAAPLIRAGRFEEAERAVLAIDDSIYGAVALGRLYTEELRRLVAEGAASPAAPSRSHAEAIFGRALHWRQSAYPEPHTQCEADNYATGRAIDHAELVSIFGSDPCDA